MLTSQSRLGTICYEDILFVVRLVTQTDITAPRIVLALVSLASLGVGVASLYPTANPDLEVSPKLIIAQQSVTATLASESAAWPRGGEITVKINFADRSVSGREITAQFRWSGGGDETWLPSCNRASVQI